MPRCPAPPLGVEEREHCAIDLLRDLQQLRGVHLLQCADGLIALSTRSEERDESVSQLVLSGARDAFDE